jgi:hypothetical protein
LSERTTGGRTPPRRFVLALAAIPLVAIVLADGVLWVRQTQDVDPARPDASQASPAVTPTTNAVQRAADRQTTEIRALLAQRATAVLEHDRAAWAATLDRRQRSFFRSQMRVFNNLEDVPFRSWSYVFDPDVVQFETPRSERYAVPTFAPKHFSLRYRLQGFDTKPTNLAQAPTFVRRGGRWLLASLTDFRSQGVRSAVDLWDFGPVSVLRRDNVLVLGHPESADIMRVVADEVSAGIPRVTAVWGDDWARRAVVLVPATQRELGRVVEDYGDLDNIAAVATAEVQIGGGRPNPVGDRIGINPDNWPELSPLGRRIVLTHELTHVASRALTSGSTPTWLAEGFADYVGYLGTGVPTSFIAQDLAADVRASGVPHTLPRDAQFDGSSEKLSEAYEGAWMACTLLVQKYGEQDLVRFYKAVGREHGLRPRAAVSTVMRRLFDAGLKTFVADWRSFVQSQLG